MALSAVGLQCRLHELHLWLGAQLSLGWCNLSHNCLVPGEIGSLWQEPALSPRRASQVLLAAAHSKVGFGLAQSCFFVIPMYQPAHGKCDLMAACLCVWSPKFFKVAEEYSHDVVLSISTRYLNCYLPSIKTQQITRSARSPQPPQFNSCFSVVSAEFCW